MSVISGGSYGATTLNINSYASAMTLLTSGASAAQKVVTVADTTGFTDNGYVSYYLTGGALETNVIDTVDNSTQLTLVTNIGTGGIPSGNPIAQHTPLENEAAGGYNNLADRFSGIDQMPGAARLATAVTAGDASATLRTTPDTVLSASGWYAIVSAGASTAEICTIDGSGNLAPADAGTFDHNHNADDVVVFVQDRIDARWFGMIGDNSTDNTASLNGLLSEVVAGMTVYLPVGTYIVDGAHSADTACRIVGEGTLKVTGSLAIDYVLRINANNCRVEGISIDQSSTTANTGRGEGLRVTGADCHITGVTVTGEDTVGGGLSNCFYLDSTALDCYLTRCTAINASYGGIRVDADHCTIRDCRSEGHAEKGLVFNGQNCEWFIVDGFYAYSTDTGAAGFLIDPNSTNLLHAMLNNIVIEGNHLVDFKVDYIDICHLTNFSFQGVDGGAGFYGVVMGSTTGDVFMSHGYVKRRIYGQPTRFFATDIHSDVSGSSGASNNYNFQFDDGDYISIKRCYLGGADVDGIYLEESGTSQVVIVDDVVLDGAAGTENLFGVGDTMRVGRILLGTFTVISGSASLTGVSNNNAMVQRNFGRPRQFVHTADPQTASLNGDWGVGDIMYDNAPTSGNPALWHCTSAGAAGSSPGTWKAGANIA